METEIKKNQKKIRQVRKNAVVLRASLQVEASYKKALAERKDAVTITNIDSYFKTLS